MITGASALGLHRYLSAEYRYPVVDGCSFQRFTYRPLDIAQFGGLHTELRGFGANRNYRTVEPPAGYVGRHRTDA